MIGMHFLLFLFSSRMVKRRWQRSKDRLVPVKKVIADFSQDRLASKMRCICLCTVHLLINKVWPARFTGKTIINDRHILISKRILLGTEQLGSEEVEWKEPIAID